MMEALDLARLQFAVTTVYHFFFVPLTLGLSVLVAIMQTMYARTQDETYKKMTKFWGKLFLINFAMGVVTGIVQEFQFGMNWSEYSRFVGDIFGAPLAIEALMAFFLESTFLGIWVFGWDKLPQRVHLASIWLVAIGTNISSFWILVANSFMQHPVGYTIAESGRAEMTDFIALITNPNVFLQFPHVVTGGFVAGAFFVVGISAWHLLRQRGENLEMYRRSMRIALMFGVVAVLVNMVFGHMQGQRMADTQPMKLAVAEAVWESEDPAGLSVFQVGNEQDREALINIRIPSLLSFLTYNTPDGLVQGINPLQAEFEEQYGPGNYVPPFIWMTYWSFRAMVGAGVLMFLIGALALFFDRQGKLENMRWLMWALVGTLALPYLANSTGWLLAEVGRQPWIVYGQMTVAQGLSPNVGVLALTISLVGYVLMYTLLIVADVYLMQKFAREDSHALLDLPQSPAADVPSGARLAGAGEGSY